MGSAALAHCAARGLRAVGIERFSPAHARGASHGRTRIIRQAYFEDPSYVPLLRRAYVLWDALEERTGAHLRARTGGLFAGKPAGPVVAGTLASAREYGLQHDVLDPADLRRRFPQFRLRDDEIAVYEAVAGALFPEECVRAQIAVAVDDGAEARFGVRATEWRVSGRDRVEVDAGGETLVARRLVIAPGAWLGELAQELALPVWVERNVAVWFEPLVAAAVSPGALPIFALEREGLPFMFYGFPDFGDGVKCAFHHSGVAIDPEAVDRPVAAAEVDGARSALAGWLPDAAGRALQSSVCTYAMTPDEHFVIGLHPAHAEVAIAGGFSGHGFKFAPVVGEMLANFVERGEAGHDARLFAPGRFAKAS